MVRTSNDVKWKRSYRHASFQPASFWESISIKVMGRLQYWNRNAIFFCILCMPCGELSLIISTLSSEAKSAWVVLHRPFNLPCYGWWKIPLSMTVGSTLFTRGSILLTHTLLTGDLVYSDQQIITFSSMGEVRKVSTLSIDFSQYSRRQGVRENGDEIVKRDWRQCRQGNFNCLNNFGPHSSSDVVRNDWNVLCR